MLQVYIDFNSPAAYLAMQPTLALVAKHGFEVEWLPFRSDQRVVPERLAKESRGYTHRRVRALARQRTHLLYASLRGLTMHFRATPGHTGVALAALCHAQPDATNFVCAAFAAYWIEKRDLDDVAVAAELLAAAGYDAARFDPVRYASTLEDIRQRAVDTGVFDTPAYVVADQMFIGREHLPWIEALLTDR